MTCVEAINDFRQSHGLLPLAICSRTANYHAFAARLRLQGAIVVRQPVTNSIGMKLLLIPAGEFRMGSRDSVKDADENEKPRHRVQITRPFFLGVHPVTQEQYEKVIGNNPSYFKNQPENPVETISWMEAVTFCNQLSERENLRSYYQISGADVTIPDPGGTGYRLPNEAEWEYACRAGSETIYFFSDNPADLGKYAWFEGNSTLKAHPVGQKRPNAFGLYDMHGSIGEWCWDWYEGRYYSQSPGTDPLGPSQGAARVFRGGGWIYYANYVRAANRGYYSPDGRVEYLGFRVARASSSPEQK
jgi:formylglycine-generating enzyme required for sulfatase activity